MEWAKPYYRGRCGQFLLCCFFLFVCASQLFAGEGVRYKVEILGINDSNLRNIVESNSQLIGSQSRPPASLIGLRLRIENDLPEILDILHSYGYYSAHLHYEIITATDPVILRLECDLGPLYSFGHFLLQPPPDLSEEKTLEIQEIIDSLLSPQDLEIHTGQPAMASKILDGQQKISDILSGSGYPYGKVAKRLVVVDQISKTVDVTFTVDTGGMIYFGDIAFMGLEKVSACWLLNKITIKEGCLYNPEVIAETRRILENTGLFTTIEIISADNPTETGRLPVTIAVVENKHRSIMFGVTYTTDQSVGGATGWESRNLWGKGEHLAFKFSINHIVQETSLSFRKPDFHRLNQDLLVQAQYKLEKLISYHDRSASLLVAIERRVSPRLSFSYGVKIEALHTTQEGEKQDFALLSLPLKVRWQLVNNVYLPSLGCVFDIRFNPHTDLANSRHTFLVQKATATFFYPLIGRDWVVLLARTSVGSIAASRTTTVPASIRFYEGSYSGLRGYAYQTVSPLDKENKPEGGRSLLLYCFEMRFKLSKSFFFSPFFDMGNVYKNSWPDFETKILRSFGGGLSYLSIIGPLRFDIAFPLDRRPNLDPNFQIYFSMGATF